MNTSYPLAAAMINQLNRVDVIANNLANANTHGYKQTGMTEGSFNNYLNNIDKKQDQSKLVQDINVLNNTVPKLNSTFTDGKIGQLVPTSNPMDFALKHPDTFFKVQAPSGETLLTRDGAFKIVDNALVTSDNYPVLTADNEPIIIEEGAEFINLIGISRSAFSNLEKVGNNNYAIKDQGSVEAIVEDNAAFISQGTLEKSNVNSVSTMVALIEAHRRFEQAQKALWSRGEMSSKLLEKIGSNR
jgi:flagellar basal-body rod protein FlgG